ncbi:transposon Tf2-9 polyprotein [Trichonephila clavipes]|nr:transposon Tf2-9 polyprotein [Trichonephila clavipes]
MRCVKLKTEELRKMCDVETRAAFPLSCKVSNLHIHASLLDLVGKNLPFSAPKNPRGIFSRKRDEPVTSAKLYQLLKNLLAPDIPSDQTLDKLKDALKKHLTPKPLIIPSRHKFLNRKQTEGEGFEQYPLLSKVELKTKLTDLKKRGIIEKVDSSEWATPVVPVVKSDGSIRLCADYSVTLNPNLIVPQHPLPRLDEIFGSLNGGKQFTKLDFKHAYLQMKVHPDSQKLMTINTHKGLYICKRLMYGLNGAPAIWQRYVDGLFQGMDGVKVFMDDARITGSDEISHFTALEEFFKKCREHGLKLNLNKSKFFQNEINFLGHRIDSKGLHKTDEKISAVVNAPVPRNVHEVKCFLGLVNFYGKFCENLATIANPLNNLTKKKNVRFLWSKDCQVAFEQIKKEICSPKILVHYDPSLPLTLASDASPVGIGCVLSHVYPDGSERPIAFASRTLSGSEKKYSQIDKEALSIVWASFEFDIIFRKMIEHGNADFLSRLPKTSEELEVRDDITIFQMSQIEALPVTSKELRQETSKDIELGPLLRALRGGKDLQGREAQYTIEDGCIMYGQRVCIPRKFRKNVLEELHAGHLGIVKMKAIARSFVYWKNIDNDIEEAAKNCVDCARYKADPPKSKVHYWEYPSMPWERIHVDFAGPIF